MAGSTEGELLQVLTAAVTPVVLVSATAVLISGVNARYMSASDRIRSPISARLGGAPLTMI